METKITSLKQLKEEFGEIIDVNKVHKSKLSGLDRLALFITEKVGSMGFFAVIVGWTVLWLGWNILAPGELQFDPFPAFVLWLFIANIIQISLMPLIMVGQNLQGKHSELRADLDFKTNKKAEKEIETVLLHLEKQQEMFKEILKRLDKLETKR